jgi:hypothetical protein
VNARRIVGEALDFLMRHGEIVAVLCFAAALLLLAAVVVDAVRHRRRRQRHAVAGSGEPSARARAVRAGVVTTVPARARPLSSDMRREPALIVPSRRADGAVRTRPPAATAH